MELQVSNSPFNQEQTELLNRLLPTLTDSQRVWLSGYLTALASAGISGGLASTAVSVQSAAPSAAAPVPAASKEITILYGSQTGNSSGLAKKFAKALEAEQYQVTLSSMGDYKTGNLKKTSQLLVIVSTHGEGEPPDSAISFYEFLNSKRAPKLDGLGFSVLALGDTSYEFFCQTGKDFDKRLEELGGHRLVPRADCDVDFSDDAGAWFSQVTAALSAGSGSAALKTEDLTAQVEAGESSYSRDNPFRAEVLENLNLNGRGSARETRHLEISLEGSGLDYEPGDSLGIYPENDPQLVDALIATLGWSGAEEVPVSKSGDLLPSREALLKHFEITVLTKPLLARLAEITGHEELVKLISPGQEETLKGYLKGRDLLDLVQDYHLQGIGPDALTGLLRKLPPRLYSIASSSKATPEEVHVTVRAVRYEAHGRQRRGVTSVQLAERVQPGDTLPVFIQHNPSFKLPKDPNTKIIMIGPGTGVAPFRAFLSEREESGAQGESWLFYGDQHFTTDFLYQVEWQRWLKDGVLTRMDVAFSRDTEQKVYVQHRMLEHSKELFNWLEQGAVVYVCGDEGSMAHDVHAALATILIQEGGLAPEAAAERLTEMQRQQRYQRDVY
ncbi:assimilatory sulfite reductase (NADPH) flavoprotein subunit [Paenibacillus apis]|uniref:assimilatory sulfite reductase (NADPH) n=1 Tax=Paenibacillus apis TaxID=1792174 RepID=A0A920CPU2_9BACL|nr:assimilatory sulfite reductase (NADPH) flavoprotein subunit [Paenibacillus apis]GIO44607.1 sulfite reductase [NADPH] flavoprotein alpha-component [Paenibacillus apis]